MREGQTDAWELPSTRYGCPDGSRSFVIAAGFIVFTFSGYEGVRVLGLMVTMMVVLGIVVDFLLLPPLLMALDRRKS